ncbi:MAG: phosphocholine cytidylyltransferase family protein [Fibrobacterota bacterium]|nr:phosphocholine cytidylyltransferase family protein [Fibrobacterota bacterium]QQS07067.1 MAG: phosphocholine cytidylyltransferase family protein [Fibrobacterota bacterium]
MKFQAIILAAGRGSRMKRLTEEVPKCLTPLAGLPLLEWQLSSLRQAGASAVTVVRGWRAEKLEGNFATIDNPEWSTSNMVVTLSKTASLLSQGPCVVSYSDIVYHPDHVRELLDAPGDIAITYDLDWLDLWSARNESDPLADAETFREEDGWLKAIGSRPKTLDEVQGQYMGLLRFSPAGWSQVEQFLSELAPEVVNKLDMTSLLSRLLERGVRIAAVSVRGKWCECDTESDLEVYESILEISEAEGRRWRHDWR